MYEAIQREKRLEKWNRAWKIRPIEEMNPEWQDLSDQAFLFSKLGPRLRGDDFFRPSLMENVRRLEAGRELLHRVA